MTQAFSNLYAIIRQIYRGLLPSFTHSLINDSKKTLEITKRTPSFYCTSILYASSQADFATTQLFTATPNQSAVKA